jgi:hypothetical protein
MRVLGSLAPGARRGGRRGKITEHRTEDAKRLLTDPDANVISVARE